MVLAHNRKRGGPFGASVTEKLRNNQLTSDGCATRLPRPCFAESELDSRLFLRSRLACF
jgi:hypothetical protein